MNHIVIAGGSGFLGTSLIAYFKEKEQRVIVLTRGVNRKEGAVDYVHWDGRSLGDWTQCLEGAAVLINMCGKSVDCRYTEKNKALIYRSRLEPTRVLGLALLKAQDPPGVWLNAASATIYRHAQDRPMTESDGEIGSGFSVDVCQQWERMFFSFDMPHVRRVALRTSIVFGKHDGALKPLAALARLGVGGRQGSGQQMVTWMHERDFCRAVAFAMDQPELEGPVVLAAPHPVANAELMRSIRHVIGVPFGLPMPQWLLELGAPIIRTETELVLKSRWILPEKLTQAGFVWNYPKLPGALEELLR